MPYATPVSTQGTPRCAPRLLPLAIAVALGTSAAAFAQTSPDVLFTSISGSPTALIPGASGATFRSFNNLDVSPSGAHWTLDARSNSSSSFDHHLLVDGQLLLRESFSTLPWNASQTWRSGAADVNDQGVVAMTADGSSAVDYLVRGDQSGMGTWTILETDQGAATGVPGGSWTFFSNPAITADGRVGIVGGVAGASSGANRVAWFDGQTVAEVGVTVPAGAVGGGPILSIQGGRDALDVSSDGQHTAYLAGLSNGFGWIVDGTVRVQSNEILPGSGFTREVFRIADARMERNGDWFVAGVNEVAGRDWVVRNGTVIAEEFDPIVPGSSEVWGLTSTLSSGFFGAAGHPSGDYVVVGAIRSSSFTAMVRNGTEEIIRTGDPIDVDGNGLMDDDAFLSSFHELGDWGANGALYAHVSLSNSGNSFIGYAIVRFDLPSTGAGPGTVYCHSAPNSTGSEARIRLSGSTSVQVDDLAIACEDLPAHSFGYFLGSVAQGNVQGPGGSQGTLCLGGTIGRQVGGVILQAGTNGMVSTPVQLNALPTPNGPIAGLPGDVWNFQYWYRDANPTVTSNFSSGISVTLQ